MFFIKQMLSEVKKIATFKQGIQHLFRISLYRNAFYLVISSGILDLTGFFFWIVAARLYPAEGIGFASAAISAIGLLVMFSTVGMDHGLIRFLPGADDKTNDMINSCFTVSGLVSVILALIFLAGLNTWSPALLPIREQPIFFIAFIVFTAVITLQHFTQRVFVAKRKTEFALWQGLIFGLSRFVPLVAMAAVFRTFGIFASWGIASFIVTIIGILFLLPRVQANYHPLPMIRKETVSDIGTFSLVNYIANIFWAVPRLAIPIMVINLLGAEANAYFYIGWAVANVLLVIPRSTALSLFAEGSYDKEKLHTNVSRSLKLILLLLIPAMILVSILADKILFLFGRAYSENAVKLLWILTASALPVTINHIYFSMKRVEMSIKSIVWFSAFIAVFTLVLSWFLLPQMNIFGAGVAWLASQGITALIAGYKIITRR